VIALTATKPVELWAMRRPQLHGHRRHRQPSGNRTGNQLTGEGRLHLVDLSSTPSGNLLVTLPDLPEAESC
jgi:hypothetical protein